MKLLFATAILALMPLKVTSTEPPKVLVNNDFRPLSQQESELGQLLFYDPILSGNRNISCATCHHPKLATADGVSLGLGEGGVGLGPKRRAGLTNSPEARIPRNAPALFNLGAHEFTALFHDGRIESDATRPNGFRTPMDDDMTAGFATILSAQTMFPVLSADEMAGHYSENDVSKAVRQGRITGDGGAWDILSKRVASNAVYAHLFNAVYPEISEGRDIAFTDISNAIGAFIEFEWRSDDSPFDDLLRGKGRLPERATKGMELFYGSAGCATCHSGPLQTDHKFHAMGTPQIGPGKATSFENHARDLGRAEVTGLEADLYAFRTPSLRNVTKTAPYGHSGAYKSLGNFIRSHVDPIFALANYDRTAAVLPPLDGVKDWWVMDRPEEVTAIRNRARIFTDHLNDLQVAQIIAFLKELEGPAALRGRLGIPNEVPSGLPIDR